MAMVHKAKAVLLVQRNEQPRVNGQHPASGVTSEPQAQDHRSVAVAYAARGWNNTRIGELLGIDDSTVSRYRKEPWWQPALDAALDRIIREPTALFNERVPAALEKLDVRMADDARPDVQMRAVTEVFDRAFGRVPTQSQGGSAVVVHIVFAPSVAEGPNPYITYDSGDVVDGEAHAIEGDDVDLMSNRSTRHNVGEGGLGGGSVPRGAGR